MQWDRKSFHASHNALYDIHFFSGGDECEEEARKYFSLFSFNPLVELLTFELNKYFRELNPFYAL